MSVVSDNTQVPFIDHARLHPVFLSHLRILDLFISLTGCPGGIAIAANSDASKGSIGGNTTHTTPTCTSAERDPGWAFSGLSCENTGRCGASERSENAVA